MFEKGRKKTGGRKKGTKNKYSMEKFLSVLEAAEKREKKQLYEVIVDEALKGDKFFVKLILSKMIPDLKSIEVLGEVLHGTLSDEECAAIQEKLRKRFESSKSNE